MNDIRSPFTGRPLPANSAIAKAKLAESAPAPAAAAPSSEVAKDKKLVQMIRPTARDRWQASTLSYYTPQVIENTFRGVMSGNLVAQWMLMDLMEQTWPRLNKNLNEIKDGAKALNRMVKPYADKDEKPTPEAIRRAKVVDKLLRTMRPNRKKLERDLDDTIYDVLDALGKGIELSEILWEETPRPVKVAGETLSLWCPRGTKWTHPRYYGFPSGADSQEELMLNAREISVTNPEFQSSSLWVPIPDDQFITSIIQQKSGHPINSSLLRILGFWWAASNFTWEWFLNFAQIFGAPIRWATYDTASATAGTIQQVLDMLAQMGSFGYAAFPAGTNLELKEAVKSAQDNPQKALLDAADLICDLMIIGQTLTSQAGRGGGGEGGGNRALGQVHKDIREERIQKAANTAAKIVSEDFVRAICRRNFGDDTECPELVIVTKANKDLLAQAQRYQILLQTPGVEISKQQFYEDNELVQPDENDDVITATAPMAQPGEPGSMDANKKPVIGSAHGRENVASEKLVANVLETLTGVEARWLGGVKPVFRELLAKAKDSSVSDADLVKAIEAVQKEMPDLFDKLNTRSLASAMESAMGAECVNGAVRGAMERKIAA
jgi:phage gp29-like protein